MLRKVAKIAENPGADWDGVWLNGKPRLTGSGSVEYRAYCDSRDDNPYEFYASSKLPQPGALYRNSGVRYTGFSTSYDGKRDGFFSYRYEATETDDKRPETSLLMLAINYMEIRRTKSPSDALKSQTP